MKALVVYESMFENTEQVARAIATGLKPFADVDVHDVGAVSPQAGERVDVIVAGGPTHAFSMTRPATREDAVRQGATHGAKSSGLREWLEGLGPGPHPQLVAAFDTRVEKVRHLPGSAARSAGKALRHLGYAAAASPESFYVTDTAGPLVDGELDRAHAWGAHIGAEAQARLDVADQYGRSPSYRRR
ncbi:MAG: flavodoxin [Propionibacteriales bacterium]|nr:flavodoxin [Propionibacteriales bacterium]